MPRRALRAPRAGACARSQSGRDDRPGEQGEQRVHDEGEDGDDDTSTGTKKPKNGLVLVCSCARKIRASATVAEAGPILCGLCRTEFTAA